MDNVKFIALSVGVHCWEDATLNGQEDKLGTIACRNGERWEPIIDIASGCILGWPEGSEAAIAYHVCDDGHYWLLDKEYSRLAKWAGSYVPDDILCVGKSGHGDSIIFKVASNGKIVDWRRPFVSKEEWTPM